MSTSAALAHDNTSRMRLLKAITVGAAAGFLSGLFGVGGGILIVPALVLGLQFDQRLAHGTSLAAVLPIATSSLLSYGTADKIDWPVGLFLASGAVAGAVIGTHLLVRMSHRALAVAFATILVVTAVRLLLDHSEAAGRAPLGVLSAAAVVLLGLVSGILSGLLGVGGGVITVPVMVVGFGVPAALAKGASLVAIVPTSIMGTWRNRKTGNADLKTATALGLAGVLFAFVAGRISVNMSESLSNDLFAAMLLIVALRMTWQLVQQRRAAIAV